MADERGTFKNTHSGADFVVTFTDANFRMICPFTDLPDFGAIKVSYIPGHYCIEGFKLVNLIRSYVARTCYHEEAVNEIYDAVASEINPRWLEVEAEFPLFSRCAGEPVKLRVVRRSRDEE